MWVKGIKARAALSIDNWMINASVDAVFGLVRVIGLLVFSYTGTPWITYLGCISRELQIRQRWVQIKVKYAVD
jgi:hypothetical protein